MTVLYRQTVTSDGAVVISNVEVDEGMTAEQWDAVWREVSYQYRVVRGARIVAGESVEDPYTEERPR